jgi:hypothetical protein
MIDTIWALTIWSKVQSQAAAYGKTLAERDQPLKWLSVPSKKVVSAVARG